MERDLNLLNLDTKDNIVNKPSIELQGLLIPGVITYVYTAPIVLDHAQLILTASSITAGTKNFDLFQYIIAFPLSFIQLGLRLSCYSRLKTPQLHGSDYL